MANVSLSVDLNAPADNVWEVVGDFNGLTKFISAIVDSSTEGAGVGAVRTLTLDNDDKIVERLDSLDDQTRKLSYSIITSPLPLDDYLAVMDVQDLGDSQSRLVWSSTFEPKGVSETEAVELLEGIYSLGFSGLQRIFK